jgi:hypothetical protein
MPENISSPSGAAGLGGLRAALLIEVDHLCAAQDVRSERGSGSGCAYLPAHNTVLGHRSHRLGIQVNATPSDEAGIGDELGIMGVRDPGFRVLTYEMSIAQR